MNIEDIFNIDYNWVDLIFLSVVLVLVYMLLLFLRKIVFNISFLGGTRSFVRRALDIILILYEPLFILVIISAFVMIKPGIHGLIVGVLLVMGFNHIRNYFHGRLFMSDKSLKEGRRIRITNQEGIITEMGRMGLQVRSDDGLHYIPYHILVTEGYVMSSGEKIGGYYRLNITREESEPGHNYLSELSNILISSPYVDGDHKPEIERSIHSQDTIDVRLLVKEEQHLNDLIALLSEYGYQSKITKSN